MVSDRDVARLSESFLDLAHAFDAEAMGDRLLFPLEMTWFYGEPVYDALPEERKLMLNRLTFCMSYYSTAVAEAATNVLNYEAVVETLIKEDPEVALYMAREVVEETSHLESFIIVIRKVLAHYGLTLDDLRAKNVSLPMANRYAQAHSLVGWLRGNLDYYYFTRFALNVNQKTVERCTIDEPRMHPHVRALLKNHAIDEARHMQMSRATGKLALGRMRSRSGAISRASATPISRRAFTWDATSSTAGSSAHARRDARALRRRGSRGAACLRRVARPQELPSDPPLVRRRGSTI
jgi:hypothetical protein